MPPKTIEEIDKLLNQKYIFKNFNILLFASEYIFKYASSTETLDGNRDLLYDLYNKAHNLEPEPEEPELTFT